MTPGPATKTTHKYIAFFKNFLKTRQSRTCDSNTNIAMNDT